MRMSFKPKEEEKKLEKKDVLLNLTKILPVTEANNVIHKICPFFITKDEMRNIYRNFPLHYKINYSDSLGPFIESEFNKDGTSYRSPWSNKYFPAKENGKHLPKELRALEEKINMIIKLYLKMYYSSDAISSAYITFTDASISNGFNCNILIQGKIDNSNVLDKSSFLETTNIISVKFMRGRDKETNRETLKVIYNTNTILLFKIKMKDSECEFNGTESCSCNKPTFIKDYFETKTHLEYIGKSIEENEGKLRAKLDTIYLKKNNYICKEIRNNDEGNKNRINNLKNICTEFEKYAEERRKKAEGKKNLD